MATNPVQLGEMLISHLTGKISGNILTALNVFSMDDPNTGDIAFHDGAFDFGEIPGRRASGDVALQVDLEVLPGDLSVGSSPPMVPAEVDEAL